MRCLVSQDFQGRHPAESGDSVVGEDDVGGKISQGAAKARCSVDALGLALEVGAFELADRQFGVVRLVLHEQDAATLPRVPMT